MKFPFKIEKRRHGYDFYIEAHGFNFKDMDDCIEEALMDITIEYVEGINCYMGGSPYSFFVEKMKEPEAEHLRNLIQYFFESHKLDVYIEYNHKYE